MILDRHSEILDRYNGIVDRNNGLVDRYNILLNICVVTGHANITYYERSQSIIKLKAAYHHAIIGLIT